MRQPMESPRPRNAAAIARAVCGAVMALASSWCAAQTSTVHAPGRAYFGPGDGFAAATGAEIYAVVCQGCHMPQGQGAKGAGAYPALAGDANLAASRYPVVTVVHGRKGMPPFGDALSDAQVAEVVNYVRSHFGNAYTDSVTPADVKAVRGGPVAAAQ